jgi:hypothetical protein
MRGNDAGREGGVLASVSVPGVLVLDTTPD